MYIDFYRRILPGILIGLLVFVFCGCTKINHLPSLFVSIPDLTPLPGSKQIISATVTDKDTADVVIVSWDISEGNPHAATGFSIEYTAPEIVTVDTIKVEANDQSGGIVTETVIINVSNGSPIIESFSVSQPAVLLGNQVTLTVIATDPESLPLTYHFSSAGNVGDFNQEELENWTATWDAPENEDLAGEYELYVTVKDSLNSSSSDTLSIVVYQRDGTIWTVDSGLKTVNKYSENGQFILSISETFISPVAVTNNYPDDHEFWIADNGLDKIFKIAEDGTTLEDYNASDITDIAFLNEDAVICALSQTNKTLKIIDGSDITTVHGFQSPNSIVVNQISNDILISDYGLQQVIKINLIDIPDSVSSDYYLDLFNGELNGPVDLSFTNFPNAEPNMLLVADKTGNKVHRIEYDEDNNNYSLLEAIDDINHPIAITVTQNYTWVIQDDGTIRNFSTASSSISTIIPIDELLNSRPRVISGDYLQDAVWIGDNTTNKIIKVLYPGVVVNGTTITGINFIEDIIVNR